MVKLLEKIKDIAERIQYGEFMIKITVSRSNVVKAELIEEKHSVLLD